ncbi:division/cell wall cluster transcriptional repressor MraZ [Patescibacteria group bacterium]|nr:division/cell wall cluster transcriptional repressor MraZ [Patescibacteria group bacterium]
MKMFLGQYNPIITDGSRIVLPKKHREQIPGDQVILSRGFESCILVYDKSDWQDKAQKQVENLKEFKTSDLERYLYTSAVEVSIDVQGRLVIPSELKDYAGIEKATSVIGVGDHIEIWSKQTWEDRFEKITEELIAQL